jgi:hypothetical protein
MTERSLPTIGVGVRARPGVTASPRPVTRTHTRDAARPAVARKEAILTTPARAGMLIGASAAVYALTLAGVAGLQADTDAGIAAARAPYQDLLAQTRAANDELEARIVKANAEVGALVATYGKVGTNVESYQTRLDSLAALVAEVQGTAAALPARIKLPTVTMRGAVAGSSRSGGGSTPKRTTAKTGASGAP